MNTKKSLTKVNIITLSLTIIISTLLSCNADNTHEEVGQSKELWRKMELSNSEIKNMALDHNVHLGKIYSKMYDFKSKKTGNEQFEEMKIQLIAGFAESNEIIAYCEFFDNVRNANLEDLLENEFEKEYVRSITSTLNSSSNHQELKDNLDLIISEIDNDSRDFFKTPLKLYAETLKESAYYWWSTEKGGSGIGYKIMEKRGKNRSMRTMRNVAETDAKAISAGMIGIAAYGSWGVLFGPVGFALTGASFIGVAVGSAFASAVF